MAVTLVRPTPTDDDGTGTTGTIFDAAWLTDFENKIDAALALLLPLAGGTLTGDLLFTDALYDIGKSGATRPRDGFFSRNVTIGNIATITTGVLRSPAATGIFLQPAAGGFLGLTISGTTGRGDFANGLTVTGTCTITGATTLSGHVAGTPTRVAGDKYVLVNSSGQIHVSADGPAT